MQNCLKILLKHSTWVKCNCNLVTVKVNYDSQLLSLFTSVTVEVLHCKSAPSEHHDSKSNKMRKESAKWSGGK